METRYRTKKSCDKNYSGMGEGTVKAERCRPGKVNGEKQPGGETEGKGVSCMSRDRI